VGCCNASHPLCINCGGQHASFDGTCPIRCEILSALRPPRDQDIPDGPNVGPPQTTPQGPTVHPNVPATLARHGPRFPPASESTKPETVTLVRSTSAQSNLAAPLPQEPLWCWQPPLQSKHRCRLERARADRRPHGSLDVDKSSPNTESFNILIIPLSWLFKSFHCSA